MPKPSYKLARQSRGTSTVQIEPVKPDTKIVDKSEPKPYNETIKPEYPEGKKPLGIVPNPISDGAHAESGTVHPGDYDRPRYSELIKT